MIAVSAAGHPSLAVGTRVIAKRQRLIRRAAAVLVDDLGDAVGGVVGVVSRRAARIGGDAEVAARVVGARAGAGVWAGQLGDIAEAVIAIARSEAARVLHGREVVLGVVGELGDAAVRVGDLVHPVQRIVGVGCVARERRIDRGLIRVAVVPVSGGHRRCTGGVDVLVELIERVEGSGVRAMKRAGGVVRLLRGTIAHRIERVADVVAGRVGDLGQPMRDVIGVGDRATVGQRDRLQQPSRIVAKAGRFGADLA